VFPTSLGILEGKSVEQIQEKVAYVSMQSPRRADIVVVVSNLDQGSLRVWSDAGIELCVCASAAPDAHASIGRVV
jgi:hypothetical protein